MEKSNPRLLKLYHRFNKKYFNSTLPAHPLINFSDEFSDRYGDFSVLEDGTFKITINPEYNRPRCVLYMTVLHEMAHANLAYKSSTHGETFHKEIARLFKLGAYRSIL